MSLPFGNSCNQTRKSGKSSICRQLSYKKTWWFCQVFHLCLLSCSLGLPWTRCTNLFFSRNTRGFYSVFNMQVCSFAGEPSKKLGLQLGTKHHLFLGWAKWSFLSHGSTSETSLRWWVSAQAPRRWWDGLPQLQTARCLPFKKGAMFGLGREHTKKTNMKTENDAQSKMLGYIGFSSLFCSEWSSNAVNKKLMLLQLLNKKSRAAPAVRLLHVTPDDHGRLSQATVLQNKEVTSKELGIEQYETLQNSPNVSSSPKKDPTWTVPTSCNVVSFGNHNQLPPCPHYTLPPRARGCKETTWRRNRAPRCAVVSTKHVGFFYGLIIQNVGDAK